MYAEGFWCHKDTQNSFRHADAFLGFAGRSEAGLSFYAKFIERKDILFLFFFSINK